MELLYCMMDLVWIWMTPAFYSQTPSQHHQDSLLFWIGLWVSIAESLEPQLLQEEWMQMMLCFTIPLIMTAAQSSDVVLRDMI